MIVLAIDTSTPRASVAIFDAGKIHFNETFVSDRTHSVDLFPILQRALKIAPRCDRIAIGLGPGSYAGIRIAISAAIGLRMGMGAELVGLPSILAIETTADEFLSVGDARREACYYAHVLNRECIEGPLLLTSRELQKKIASRLSLPLFAAEPLDDVPQARAAFPSAEILAGLAAQNRGICATGSLEPIYLRPPHITMPKNRTATGGIAL